MTAESAVPPVLTTSGVNGMRIGRVDRPGVAGLDLTQLRRLQWAVRAILALGVAASVCANVLHARDDLIAKAIAAWPPLALLLTVELVSRVPVYRRSLAAVRIAATAAIAGIAAYVSYWHMAAVAARYGENGVAPYLLPLSVDGLIVVASVSLVELAGRVRAARAEQHREAIRQPDDAVNKPSAFSDELRENRRSENPNADSSTPVVSAVPIAHSGVRPRSDPKPQADQAAGADRSACSSDVNDLLPAARAAWATLRREGRSLSRDSLAAQLRADGHTIATSRVSGLVSMLRADALSNRTNGHQAVPPH